MMNVLKSEIKRGLFSYKFVLCFVGVAIVLFPTIIGFLRDNETGSWFLLETALRGSGIETTIYFIFPVLPFALSYAMEKEAHADRFLCIRSGVLPYAISKLLVAAITGFLTLFCGMFLFVAVYLPSRSLLTEIHAGGVYMEWAAEGHEWGGFILALIHYSLSGMITAVCAIWASSLVANKYVAAATPTILYATILRFSSQADVFAAWNPLYWIAGIHYAETVGETFLIKVITTLVLCTLMGVFTCINIQRRFVNE